MERREFLRAASTTVAAGAAAPALLAGQAQARTAGHFRLAGGFPGDGGSRSRPPLWMLARELKGQLVLPRSPDYAAENLPANDRYENIRPIAIALCDNTRDVVACVNWCRDYGVQPVARGGGHSYIGASTTPGLLIKTGAMNRVRVDARRGTVALQAGALNENLLATLRGGDLMLPIGTCPSVGVPGLTLGGGIGDNSRWAGMTSDHLISTELVLASGELVTASETEHPDLFWALRGAAGGNYGINTQMTFRLVPLKRRVISVFGMLFNGPGSSAAALQAFDRLMLTAPPELSGFAGLTSERPLGAGDGGGDPALFPQFSVDGSYQGPVTELRELLRPVTEAATPNAYISGDMDYWTAQINWLAVGPQPEHGFAEAARFTRAPLPTRVVENLISLVMAAPTGADAYGEVRLMGWSGGMVDQVSPSATAYVHRNSNSLLRPAVWWIAHTPKTLQRELLDWMAESWRYIQPYTQDQAFQNWPYEGITDWPTAYYGANFPRLVQVKRQYDPHNLFRYSQSIPTSLI